MSTKTDNEIIEVGVLVVLRVPRRMVSAAEYEVSTCISFGQPVVTMIYGVPARQADASSRQDVKHFKPSTVPLSA